MVVGITTSWSNSPRRPVGASGVRYEATAQPRQLTAGLVHGRWHPLRYLAGVPEQARMIVSILLDRAMWMVVGVVF